VSKRIVKNIFENSENDKIAISSENNSKISYRDLKIFVEDISKQLSGNGISNKDRAAIVLPNGPSMATSFLGISSYMSAAPLNPSYKSEEYEFYLKDLNPKIIIVEKNSNNPSVEVAKKLNIEICELKIHKDHVIENISKLVVKPTNGSGGNGILIGPKASKEERENMIDKIKAKPCDYIAQPLEILSTNPTISEEGIEPRHLDLRPFVLTGKKSWVTTGGLTRVALKKGSTIVNSSQGGGSKDTLVIER